MCWGIVPWGDLVLPLRLWEIKVRARLAQTSTSLAKISILWRTFRLSGCACHTGPSLDDWCRVHGFRGGRTELGNGAAVG